MLPPVADILPCSEKPSSYRFLFQFRARTSESTRMPSSNPSIDRARTQLNRIFDYFKPASVAHLDTKPEIFLIPLRPVPAYSHKFVFHHRSCVEDGNASLIPPVLLRNVPFSVSCESVCLADMCRDCRRLTHRCAVFSLWRREVRLRTSLQNPAHDRSKRLRLRVPG